MNGGMGKEWMVWSWMSKKKKPTNHHWEEGEANTIPHENHMFIWNRISFGMFCGCFVISRSFTIICICVLIFVNSKCLGECEVECVKRTQVKWTWYKYKLYATPKYDDDDNNKANNWPTNKNEKEKCSKIAYRNYKQVHQCSRQFSFNWPNVVYTAEQSIVCCLMIVWENSSAIWLSTVYINNHVLCYFFSFCFSSLEFYFNRFTIWSGHLNEIPKLCECF